MKERAATKILITPVEFWSKVMGETKEEESCIKLRLAERNGTRGEGRRGPPLCVSLSNMEEVKARCNWGKRKKKHMGIEKKKKKGRGPHKSTFCRYILNIKSQKITWS